MYSCIYDDTINFIVAHDFYIYWPPTISNHYVRSVFLSYINSIKHEAELALAGWMCECGRRLHINSIYESNCLRWHTELRVLHRFTFSATYRLYYAATARAQHNSLSFYVSSSISNNNDNNNNFCRFFFPSLLSRMLMRFVDIGTIRCRHRCYCYICFANSHCTHTHDAFSRLNANIFQSGTISRTQFFLCSSYSWHLL